MTEQIDVLQFIESQINLLKRFNSRLEKVLTGIKCHSLYVVLECFTDPNLGDNQLWECRISIDGDQYMGQDITPRMAVLACLEKAKEDLGVETDA